MRQTFKDVAHSLTLQLSGGIVFTIYEKVIELLL